MLIDVLSYCEKRILQVLDQNKEGLTTVNVAEKAGISKTTALKYLASFRSSGIIEYIEVGPLKLWRHNKLKSEKQKHLPASRTEKIDSVVKEFMQILGLEGSAIVDCDGLTISAELPSGSTRRKLAPQYQGFFNLPQNLPAWRK